MSSQKYTIVIHISRKNTFRGEFDDVAYPGQPIGKTGDKIRFLTQKIVIVANRSAYAKDVVILENRSNSLHSQVVKSLLVLYTENQKRVFVSGIEIKRGSSKGRLYRIDAKTQPIKSDLNLSCAFPASVKSIIWEESTRAKLLRVILTHYYSALGSISDRYFAFERLWRSFEQLSSWHSLHGLGRPNEFLAMSDMRSFICSNPNVMRQSSKVAGVLGSKDIKNRFSWYQYLNNEFPISGTDGCFQRYRDFFVGNYTDFRIMRFHKEILPYRSARLAALGLLASTQAYILRYLRVPDRCLRDEEIVAFLCCRYCYFLRNKIFHGEFTEYTFRFYAQTNEDETVDLLNRILAATVFDLLMKYDSL